MRKVIIKNIRIIIWRKICRRFLVFVGLCFLFEFIRIFMYFQFLPFMSCICLNLFYIDFIKLVVVGH